MKRNSRFAYVYLSIVTALTYVPIVVTVVYSFFTSASPARWEGVSLVWYAKLLKDKALWEGLKNSLILGVLACLVAIVIGTLGALGMHRTSYRSNGFIRWVTNLPIMIPEVILGIVYLAVFTLFRLPFGMLTLVIGHATFCVPYVFLLVSGRLEGMNPSLVEAARDLGATPNQAFWHITVPEILPGIVSGLVLSFAMSFDDVVISVFVTGANVNVLPVLIYTRLKTGVTPEINALATILIVAVVVGILVCYELAPYLRRKYEE